MSPARARTSQSAIVAAARDLLEEGGIEAVSMAGVAEQMGIRGPSLYKHVADRNALLSAVATDVALDLGRTLTRAVERAGAGPTVRLRSIATAYRSFALATPRAAGLLFSSIAPGATPTMASQVEAVRPLLDAAEAIVGHARALAAARVLTAFAHGFTDMESAGGLPAGRRGGGGLSTRHLGPAGRVGAGRRRLVQRTGERGARVMAVTRRHHSGMWQSGTLWRPTAPRRATDVSRSGTPQIFERAGARPYLAQLDAAHGPGWCRGGACNRTHQQRDALRVSGLTSLRLPSRRRSRPPQRLEHTIPGWTAREVRPTL